MDDMIHSVINVAQRHIEEENVSLLHDPNAALTVISANSLEMVSFILDLETSFSLQFPSTMMVPETFRTVQTVVDAIRALRAQEA